jgi:N-acetylglucosaminyl-diphospho-decaprenol L-rhamnosyltransferase
MSISVVIVHYETPDLLEECLRSLGQAGGPAPDILVVDNSSRLKARPVTERFPGVRLLENADNVGFARAANQGLRNTDRDWVLILNPDTRVLPGTLEELEHFGEAHPDAGIVAPRLLNPDGTLQYSCRRFYTLRTLLYRRTFLARWMRNSRTSRAHLMLDYDHREPRPVDWVLGGAMLVRRRAVEDVGGADERFFLYFEDVDWCFRMGKRGWRVWYVPGAAMEHHHRRESARDFRGLRRHLMSSLRFYEKWSLLLYVAKQSQAQALGLATVLADVLAVNAAFLVAFLLRSQLGFALTKPLYPLAFYKDFLVLINLVVLGTLLARGLYRNRPGDWAARLVELGKSQAWACMILMAATYAAYVRSYSRALVLFFYPCSLLALFLGRWLVDRGAQALSRRLGARPRALLAGVEPELSDAARRVEEAEPAYEWCGHTNLDRLGAGQPAGEQGRLLAELVRNERVLVLVLAFPAERAAEFWPAVDRCAEAGVDLRIYSEYTPWLRPGDRIEPFGALHMLRVSAELPIERSLVARRLLGVAVALALLPVALPALAVAWLGLLLAGRGPVWRRETWDAGHGHPLASRCLGARRGDSALLRRLGLDRAVLLVHLLTGRLGLVGGPLRPYAEPSADGEAGPPGPPAGLTGPWYVEPGRIHSERDLERWMRQADLSSDLRILVRSVACWMGRARGRVTDVEGAGR